MSQTGFNVKLKMELINRYKLNMCRAKLFFGAVILSSVALLAGACSSQPSLTPGLEVLEVEDATEAGATAILYLRTQVGEKAPAPDTEWSVKDNVASLGVVREHSLELTSDEWTITVSHPIAPPENAVYKVVVFNPKLGWHWKGTVEPDGSVKELSAFKQITEEESLKAAEEFVKNSPTFAFDGIEGTLRLTDTVGAPSRYYWIFSFEFDSERAGYGDRTGKPIAHTRKSHQAQVYVKQGEVSGALMDNYWDMVNQKVLVPC